MAWITFLYTAILFGSVPVISPPETIDIQYFVSAKLSKDQAIGVSFDYVTDEKGELLLHYQDESWGEENLFKCISDFTVNKKAKVEFLPAENTIRITAKPKQKLTIAYAIRQDFRPPLYNYHRYRPIVTDTYFHSLAMRVFIEPMDLFKKNEREVATIKIVGQFPADYEFQTSFGRSRTQTFTLNQLDFNNSLIVAGDFRRYETKIDKATINFLARGKWELIDEVRMFDQLKGIISAQTEFWNEPLDSLFTVTLIPTDEEWTETSKSISIGGSGLTDSFISFASNNAGTPQSMMQWLYSHELMHRWIGGIIENADEEKQYWFSEGFTDFYAYKILVKSGHWSEEDFVNKLNTSILPEYERNPVKTVPNDSITQETFWSNYNYQKLPYQRGLLYALLIDQQIKQQSGGRLSLDNLMADLLQACKAHAPLRMNSSLWLAHMSKYLGEEVNLQFEQYIVKGQPIDFSSHFLPEYEWTDGRFSLRKIRNF